MKKPILFSIALSALLVVTTNMICYIAEAHKGIKRLSEAAFYSVVFCLSLMLALAIIIPSGILIYKLKENLAEQIEAGNCIFSSDQMSGSSSRGYSVSISQWS